MSGEGAPPPADPAPPPPTLVCLSAAFRSGRPVWSPRYLMPLWPIALLLWYGTRWIPDWFSGREAPAVSSLLAAAGGILAAAGGLALSVVLAGWEFGRGERLTVREGIAALIARWRAAFIGPLFAPLGAAIFALLALAGAAFLDLIPGAGRTLAWIWLVFPGGVISLLAGGLILLGLPAMPFVLAAGALEPSFPFDAAARGMSYLRNRPCLALAALACGVAGAAAGALLFAIFLALALAPALLAWWWFLHGAGAAFTAAEALAVGKAGFLNLDPCWPIGESVGMARVADLPVLLVLGRLVTAHFLAGCGAAIARAYLLLRWAVEGEAPSALVRPGEEFAWKDGSSGASTDRERSLSR